MDILRKEQTIREAIARKDNSLLERFRRFIKRKIRYLMQGRINPIRQEKE